MNLFEKIKTIYPDINDNDFNPIFGTITLQNDSDEKGDYIANWNHPTYARPTQQQLDALENVEYVEPPKPEPTPLEKLEAAGLTISDLKTLLGLQ